MDPIRVLVVDDSVFIRDVIASILSTDDDIKVIGEAANGREAVEKVLTLKPDLVTMDIDMPVMSGLEAIEEIMARQPVPILVITSHTDSKTAYSAISNGALEVVEKPEIDSDKTEKFIKNIKLLSKVKVISHIRGSSHRSRIDNDKKSETGKKIIAIASSTGGPRALSTILSNLPENLNIPIVVAQHITDDFVPGMVQWLNEASRLEVRLGKVGEMLKAGKVYISPSENHMEINSQKAIAFVERAQNDIYFPSCDLLLSSVANVYGAGSVGIILTGMGSDGVLGIRKIRDAGGITIAQDEETSVVFGMPKVAIKNGCIDKVLPINDVSGEITHLTRTKN